MKTDFHPVADGSIGDGKDSQYGLKNTYRAELYNKDYDPPKPSRWIRPKPSPGKDVRVAKILFPTDHLQAILTDDRENYNRPEEAKRKWRFSLPMAEKGQAVEVSLIYSLKQGEEELAEAFIKRGFTPMHILSLPCGEKVLIAGRNIPFDNKIIPAPGKYPATQLDGMENIDDHEDDLLGTYSIIPKDFGVLVLAEVSGLSFDKSAS